MRRTPRPTLAVMVLALSACAQTPPTARCAALAPTCGGDPWVTWCESSCLPPSARTHPCDDGDLCALCDDAGNVFTIANGCDAWPAQCDDSDPCPLGRRPAPDGACVLSEPCAGDTQCSALGRLCVASDGVASCDRCLDDGVEQDGACVDGTVAFVGPYRVSRDHFMVWDGARYRRLFLRGVNVGGARPGEFADDTSLTVADWTRWMTTWADAGFNVLRVYRLHQPELYEALLQWNAGAPDRPIYLMQGVYYPDVSAGDSLDLFGGGASFDDLVANAIDCVHGHCAGYPDASAWTIGWLIGREIGASEVLATDAAHTDIDAYTGTALSIEGTTPSAVWMVQRMDHAIAGERARYAAERPIAYTFWPPLDPITHPTERPIWQADVASVDLATVDATLAPAGHFISYHAYPYDPDFLSEDTDYLWCADRFGPDSYRGYLGALRAHYRDQAVLIAEFGVPTSIAPAHTSPSGMSQGGLDEGRQGMFAARMLENIQDVDDAGGIWFQWEDGWWKREWTSLGRAFPIDRFPLWHDRLNPEQAFGLLSFEPPMSSLVALTTTPSSDRVIAVRASASAAEVHFEIELATPLAANETMEIGLDVLDRERGEPLLPSGIALHASRAELAITMTPSEARIRITPCLDLNRELDFAFTARTQAGGCGGWAEVRWILVNAHLRPPTQCYASREYFDLGALHLRAATDPETSLDEVVIDGSTIRFDLPWNLLVVADPSTRSVLDDIASTPDTDATVTDGIVLAIALNGELVETSPYAWDTWDVAPATTERLKDGAETFFSYTRAMPRWLD